MLPIPYLHVSEKHKDREDPQRCCRGQCFQVKLTAIDFLQGEGSLLVGLREPSSLYFPKHFREVFMEDTLENRWVLHTYLRTSVRNAVA